MAAHPILFRPSVEWSDPDLVAECLAGSREAWAALIEKYKRMVYAAPISQYRFSQADAADIFQDVWLEVYQQLPNLRDVGAFRGWLMRITLNRCYQLNRTQKREAPVEKACQACVDPAPLSSTAMEMAEDVRRMLQLIETLSPRCQTIIRSLFFTEPAVPYADLARSLGLAEGSIGFMRGRCLEKLRMAIEAHG